MPNLIPLRIYKDDFNSFDFENQKLLAVNGFEIVESIHDNIVEIFITEEEYLYFNIKYSDEIQILPAGYLGFRTHNFLKIRNEIYKYLISTRSEK